MKRTIDSISVGRREERICDTCEATLKIDDATLAVNAIYLTHVDTEYDFCNWQCLLEFIKQEITKEP